MTTTLLLLAITLLISLWLHRKIRAHRSQAKIAAISAYFTEMEGLLEQNDRDINALARESRRLEKLSNPEEQQSKRTRPQKQAQPIFSDSKPINKSPATEIGSNLPPSAPSAAPRETPSRRRQAKVPSPPIPPTIQFQKPSLLKLCITKIQFTLIRAAQILRSITQVLWPIKSLFFRRPPDTLAPASQPDNHPEERAA
jgi:hypothetical protein